jgi:hypothetical protein
LGQQGPGVATALQPDPRVAVLIAPDGSALIVREVLAAVAVAEKAAKMKTVEEAAAVKAAEEAAVVKVATDKATMKKVVADKATVT